MNQFGLLEQEKFQKSKELFETIKFIKKKI